MVFTYSPMIFRANEQNVLVSMISSDPYYFCHQWPQSNHIGNGYLQRCPSWPKGNWINFQVRVSTVSTKTTYQRILVSSDYYFQYCTLITSHIKVQNILILCLFMDIPCYLNNLYLSVASVSFHQVRILHFLKWGL